MTNYFIHMKTTQKNQNKKLIDRCFKKYLIF